jgi:hypothetical protein
MSMEVLPEELFLDAVHTTVAANADYVGDRRKANALTGNHFILALSSVKFAGSWLHLVCLNLYSPKLADDAST